MERRYQAILLLIGSLDVLACNNASQKPDMPMKEAPAAVASAQAGVEYYCPMHPQITAERTRDLLHLQDEARSAAEACPVKGCRTRIVGNALRLRAAEV